MTTRRDHRKVLVLGHDTRAFLGVVRSLGRAGICVHVAWYLPGGVALRSRYIRRAHELPPFSESDDAWKAALANLLEREQYDLVVPCGDAPVTALQSHREVFEPHAKLCVVNDEAYALFCDKFKTLAHAESVGVPTPRETIAHTKDEARQALADYGLPIVLKPNTSHHPHDMFAKRMVRKAYTEDQFLRLWSNMTKQGPVSVQENLIGRGVGVELLALRGEPLLIFQHIRIHEPLHGGGSSYRKGVAVRADLLDASLKLLRPLSYTGVAMVEFKVDPLTGRWAFLEVNPRFWGSLPLAIASGANFPLAAFDMMTEGRTQWPTPPRVGLFSRNITADLVWQRANLRADRSDPTLATRPLLHVFTDTILHVLTLRERLDTLTWDDPIPGLAEILRLVRITTTRVCDKLTMIFQGRSFMRQRLAKRALNAITHARHVLVLCKGNVCRSPYAEHRLRRVGLDCTIESAGYYPHAGRCCPDTAIAVAGDHDVNLSQHRSCVVTETMLEQADMIFVFDQENRKTLVGKYAVPPQRIHFLGALNPAGPLLIADPWNQDRERFEQIYRHIDDAITRTQPHA